MNLELITRKGSRLMTSCFYVTHIALRDTFPRNIFDEFIHITHPHQSKADAYCDYIISFDGIKAENTYTDHCKGSRAYMPNGTSHDEQIA